MRGRGTLASQRQRDEDEAHPCPALWATGSGSSSRNRGVPVRSGQEPRPDQALAWPAPQGRQVHPAPPDVDRGACVHEEKHQRGGCSLPTALCAPGHSRALRRGVRQPSSHTHSLGWAWMGQGPPATPQGLLPQATASGWEVSALPPAEGGSLWVTCTPAVHPPLAGGCIASWAQPVRG